MHRCRDQWSHAWLITGEVYAIWRVEEEITSSCNDVLVVSGFRLTNTTATIRWPNQLRCKWSNEGVDLSCYYHVLKLSTFNVL